MIKLQDINIKYDETIIEDSQITIPSQSVTLIQGISGSGKTSLLYILSLISKTQCQYHINDTDINQLNDIDKSLLRRFHIGYVLQDCSLFEHLNVLENLEFYSSLAQKKYTHKEYMALLKTMQLDISLLQNLNTLSGGERQRLSIACILCKMPDILILDEPTSALDEENERIIFSLLNTIAHKYKKTVIIASHSDYAKEYADVIYEIRDKHIYCLTPIIDNQITLNIRKRTFSYSFLKNYLHSHLKKYKKMNMILNLTLCIIYLILNISIIFVGTYTYNAKQSLLSHCDGQILVVKDENIKNLSSSLTPFSINEIKNILPKKYDEHIYPYIHATLFYENNYNFNLFPYFSHKYLSSRIIYENEINDGIYLNNNASFDVGRYDSTYQNIKGELIVNGKQVKDNAEFKIQDVLTVDYQIPYFDKDYSVLLINYKDLEPYQKQYTDAGCFIITIDDMDQYFEVKELLKDNNFHFVEPSDDIEMIETRVQWINRLEKILFVIVVCSFIFFILLEQVNYFFKKRKENALLKMNGLMNKELFHLSLLEFIYQLLFCNVFSFIMTLIVFTFIESIIELKMIITVDIILTLVLVIVHSLFLKASIKKIIPEEVFRN